MFKKFILAAALLFSVQSAFAFQTEIGEIPSEVAMKKQGDNFYSILGKGKVRFMLNIAAADANTLRYEMFDEHFELKGIADVTFTSTKKGNKENIKIVVFDERGYEKMTIQQKSHTVNGKVKYLNGQYFLKEPLDGFIVGDTTIDLFNTKMKVWNLSGELVSELRLPNLIMSGVGLTLYETQDPAIDFRVIAFLSLSELSK